MRCALSPSMSTSQVCLRTRLRSAHSGASADLSDVLWQRLCSTVAEVLGCVPTVVGPQTDQEPRQ